MSAPAEDKAFADLRAKYALVGYELHRTDARDGPVRYFCTHRDLIYPLSLQRAQTFLAQIGGAQ